MAYVEGLPVPNEVRGGKDKLYGAVTGFP